MDWPSWFRRSLSRAKNNENAPNPDHPKHSSPRTHGQVATQDDVQMFGVTDQLIDHVKSFTLDTFKNFPHQEEHEATTTAAGASANVRKDLSEWQERHATLVLSRVKELSQLRFVLCPRHLKEQQFWRIYFMLVNSHVSEYELRAIQLAKLKRMAIEKEESSDAGAYEVEMAETKKAPRLTPPTP